MARPSRSTARRRALAVLTAAATVAGGAALLGPGTSSASSHREAPYTSSDPNIDGTDLYAFNSDADTTTLIANYIPFEDPAGGPNFFPFATDARYNINIDNNGDGVADTTFRWTFKNVDNRGTTKHFGADAPAGTFLYNDGPVTSLTDDNLLFRQTYTLEQITDPTSTSPVSTTILSDVPVPPDNVGAASIPDYAALRNQAVQAGTVGSGPFSGVQAYAGQRNDPFFLDLRIFDLLYGGKATFPESGFNSIKDKNVKSLAIRVPKALLAGGHDVNANPVVGVWTTAERHSARALQATNAAPATSQSVSSDEVAPSSANDWVQVSRLGSPLVNEAVVPANLKDFFNRLTPDVDHTLAPLAQKVQDPEVPRVVEALYGITNPNSTPKGKGRPDLVQAFLTGLPGLNNQGTDNANGKNADGSPVATLAEELRLNLKTPVTAQPNRLGAVGGDNQGFPNGRRLSDDVVDIALQVLEGVLVPDQDPAIKNAIKGLGDGVVQQDPLLASFPYAADPLSGSSVPPAPQSAVTFKQTFTSDRGYVTSQVTNISPPAPGGYVQLYRYNADGSVRGLGSMTLDSRGTTSGVGHFFIGSGQRITLNYRVFPKNGSSSLLNRGIPTTFTVK